MSARTAFAQAIARSSSAGSSHRPSGCTHQVASRLAIGHLPACAAIAPPHGSSACCDGEGTTMSDARLQYAVTASSGRWARCSAVQ
jgi:hypothetical protein